MEKTIDIGGKKLKLRTSGATPIIYRNQFDSDFFSDILKLYKTYPNKPMEKWTVSDINKVDLLVFYRFLWAVAKTSDRKIPEMVDWLDKFEYVNVAEVIPEIQDLMEESISGKKH